MVGYDVDLTVGYVAGIIAVAVVVARLFCPMVIAYILGGLLKDTESAATWTVAGQRLQSTLWPYLVSADSVHNGGRVRRLIRMATASVPVVTVLTAIASVVTPLGLGEEVVPLGETRGSFQYAQDAGPYAFGTTPRGVHDFSRICEQGPGLRGGPAVCPFSDNIVNVEDNGTTITWDMPDGYNVSVPDEVVEIFSSGTKGRDTTVSNFFDIEWRQMTTRRSENYHNNETFSAGLYRQLDSFILDGEYKLLEGLVVDARSGGIGFRNHTAPLGLENGAVWTEDLLFVEPVSACVNTNLTVDFEALTDFSQGSEEISAGSGGNFRDVRIIDRGGFYDLNQTYPDFDLSDPQANPDLAGRAYKAAWIHNANTMLYMNITNPNYEEGNLTAFSYVNSEEDQEFSLGNETNIQDFRRLDLSSDFGSLLRLPSNTSFDSDFSSFDESSRFPNPWNVTTDNFGDINIICGGGNADIANMSLIYVGCSLIRGAPRRTSPGPQGTFEQGSKWSSPLHACATALEATVKTVEFSSNSTDDADGGLGGIESLEVRSIAPKSYAAPDDAPLWGMEDFNLTIGGYAPVWGLISSDYESRENVSALRSPRLLLPGLSGSDAHATTISHASAMLYNLPGANFAFAVMNKVLEISDSVGSDWPFDLLGGSSMAIFKRWQELSSEADTAAEIISLIWTDLAASAVVGTKGALGELNQDGESIPIQIRPYGTRITYNLLFGIPAFILAVVIAILILLAIVATLFGGASVSRMRTRLAQVSVGRAFTTFLYPHESTLTMPSGRWRKMNGEKIVRMGDFAQSGEVHHVENRGLVDRQKGGNYSP